MSRARAALAAGLALCLAPAPLFAQDGSLRAIRLERQDLFSPSEADRYFFARLANALHITTVHRVISREVLLVPGQPWDSALAEETARNLRALGVFRLVEVDSVRTDSGLVAVVRTRDGWSTSLDASYRRTGGSEDWGIAIREQNLLGTVTKAEIGYRNSPDRTTWGAAFFQPRLILGQVGLGAGVQERSDGRTAYVTLLQPFYSLSSRAAWSALADARDETIYRYREGVTPAQDTVARRYSLGRLDGALALRASPAGYTRLGAFVQFRRDDYAPPAEENTIGRTVTAALGAALEWRRARYVVARGFQGIGQQEDVDLSQVGRAGLALTPSAFGYDRDGAVPSVAARIAARRGHAMGWAETVAHGRFTSAGLDSGQVRLALTGFVSPSEFQSLVLHAEAGWQENPAPGAEFDFGLSLGPRAFGAHAFTGDRAVFATAEYRVYPFPNLLGLVSIGAAGFVDWGGAWYHGEPRRTGWNTGLGLRLGASRASEPRALRFDLSRRAAVEGIDAGWVLSVGTGLVFSPRLF